MNNQEKTMLDNKEHTTKLGNIMLNSKEQATKLYKTNLETPSKHKKHIAKLHSKQNDKQ